MSVDHVVVGAAAKRPVAQRVGFYASASLKGLQPGDVLLYHGCDAFARCIQHFDATPYFHAALLVEQGVVAESVMAGGVGTRPLAETFRRREWATVRRYRAELLPPRAEKAGVHPVVAQARAMVRTSPRYDYEQLLPLALLLLTRKVPQTASFGRVVVGLLERLNSQLRSARKKSDGSQAAAWVCSKFVAECYAGAGTADPAGGPYALQLRPAADAASAKGAATLLAEVRHAVETEAGHSDARGVAPSGAPPSEPELEILVTAYLDEVRGRAPLQRTALRGAEVDPRRLHSAVAAFAALLAEQAAGESLATRGRLGAQGGAAALAWLTAYAGRLVTPGDLGRSPSLEDVGMLRPAGGVTAAKGRDVPAARSRAHVAATRGRAVARR